ncbi:MAG: LamG domain-containing protein [Gammaproteobacteria bacterium]|nr:LamG domain-containing protein [Gammaproteobacteria bacterium]
MKSVTTKLRAILAILVGATLLYGCGTGSGARTSANPVTTTPDVNNYNGPPPAAPDVQTFKLALWDNLVPNNRCGSCHNLDQSPRFVRADDINLAYDAANTVVVLADPAMSIMVAKVRGGHNCWLSDDNACGDIIETYVENWAGATLGGAAKTVQLVAPVLQAPGQSKNFPDDPSLFSTTVYPLLTQYCSNCHSENAPVPQQPYFANSDVNSAYDAAKTKMDLNTPANSRFVLRLGNEFHNCWDSCQANASEMQAEITNFSNGVALTQVDPDLVTSMALRLVDGIISSSGGRFEANVIALYEFKTGSGNQVFDTSGVEPALNLTLSGNYTWIGGWGVQFVDGKAQGSTAASAKLHDLLASTGEFSIEAWVAAANVTQNGPARIVTYSGGPTARNFMLGQSMYDYDAFTRTDQTDPAGEPQLSTPAADEVLQATQQHVVLNYDPINGRSIYVNGQLRSDIEPVPGGLLNEWDDTYAFVLGSEVDNNNRWAGTVRLLAVHNRVLSPAQIQQNFDVGVGEKYYLMFNVSDHVNIVDAYVVVEVSQFDSSAYLFDEPFFAVLGTGVTLGNIPIQGMRIGENGRELEVGQGFQNMDVTINDVDYAVEGMQPMSRQGTVIPLEKGPDQDEFFLTFEVLGSSTNVVTEPVPLAPPPPPSVPRDPPSGLRNFAAVTETMSKRTGIPVSNPDVMSTYNAVYQAMPVQTKIAGFISSQQMGITQLAIEYCAAVVDDSSARAIFWPDFDWNASLATAFDDRNAVTDQLVANFVGVSLPTQPSVAALEGEVNALIDRLVNCGGSCESDRVERIMKGTCAAVLGSAVMLVQ